MSRRQVMAARAITRQRATRAEAALLDPSSTRRFHNVKLALARDTPEFMRANPNSGKHHAARMTDAFLAELERAESRAYTALTVETPLRTKTGRHSRRAGAPTYSRYTV